MRYEMNPVNYFWVELDGWDEIEENRIEYRMSECIPHEVKYCLATILFVLYVCVCIFVHVCWDKHVKDISYGISQSKKFWKTPKKDKYKIHGEKTSQDSKVALEIKYRQGEE